MQKILSRNALKKRTDELIAAAKVEYPNGKVRMAPKRGDGNMLRKVK